MANKWPLTLTVESISIGKTASSPPSAPAQPRARQMPIPSLEFPSIHRVTTIQGQIRPALTLLPVRKDGTKKKSAFFAFLVKFLRREGPLRSASTLACAL